jgi:hypothetical protein
MYVATPYRHVLWAVCLPVTHLLDLPVSLSQVLVSLAMVAAVNYVLIWGARAATASLAARRVSHYSFP